MCFNYYFGIFPFFFSLDRRTFRFAGEIALNRIFTISVFSFSFLVLEFYISFGRGIALRRMIKRRQKKKGLNRILSNRREKKGILLVTNNNNSWGCIFFFFTFVGAVKRPRIKRMCGKAMATSADIGLVKWRSL